MFIGLSYETLATLIIVAIFLSLILCIAYNNLKQLFCAYCCKKQTQPDSLGVYENGFKFPVEDSADRVVRNIGSISSREESATEDNLPPPVKTPLSVLPVSSLNGSSSEDQKGSQHFMKILKEIEALDEDSRELAIERERQRRRRRLAEEQRQLSRAVSSSSGVIEANSSDETSSQTLIGLPSDAAPQDPGKIQLGLIVGHD